MRKIGIVLFGVIFLSACKPNNMSNRDTVYAFRLKPGEDLQKGIER